MYSVHTQQLSYVLKKSAYDRSDRSNVLLGIRNGDERFGPKRPLCAPAKLSTRSPAGGDVEEVHPVGEEQPATYRRPNTNH